MDTAGTTPGLPSDLQADTDALMAHLTSGQPLDPEVACRIHERAARITEEVRRKHGTLNIAVDLIREARDMEWECASQ
jgi:hypothetical protein